MRLIVALLAWAALASSVFAQIPLVPENQPNNQQVSCGSFENPASKIATLRDFYLAGKWLELVRETKSLLESCTYRAESSDPHLFPNSKPDFNRDWYTVVLGTVDSNDEPLVLRYIVHDPVPYPFSSTVLDIPAARRDARGRSRVDPMIPRLVQVFLAPTKAVVLQTRIQVSETPNPVTEQIADVLKAVVDPSIVVPLLKGIVPPSRGALAPARPLGPVLASVSRVFPPFSRGEYKYTDTLRVLPVLEGDKNLLLRADLDALVEAAGQALEAAEKNNSPNRQLLAKELELAKQLSAKAASYLTKSGTTACAAATYQERCWLELEVLLDEGRETFCSGEPTFCDSERDELVAIRFKKATTPPKSVVATASSTAVVVPRERLSFGVVSAYIAAASASRDRVKVDGGKLTADPIGRALNAVILNVHPLFNPKAPVMEPQERIRIFVGGVVTPNLGATVGGGYGFLRNLSVNAGYALLWIPTLREGDVLGEAPVDGTKPFESGAAHAAFLGIGYKFGK
jgi:hypothetical protein